MTDYRHYDTIYTERYMWTPQENKEGYDAGSAMTYADNLKGRLMLYLRHGRQQRPPLEHAAAHPGPAAGRQELRVQVGPDQGHSAISRDRMMEFFIENLVLAKP